MIEGETTVELLGEADGISRFKYEISKFNGTIFGIAIFGKYYWPMVSPSTMMHAFHLFIIFNPTKSIQCTICYRISRVVDKL